MQRWVVICWALVALAGADECPDGGRCEEGQTCCNDPASGFECCPFDQAECCGDHVHCCPADTTCDAATSSCVNATASVPWAERAPAERPRLLKSFRMIKSYMGEEDDNICPDQSRCPPEFSCLKALTRFGCCPLAQGVPCADGKHCCPEGHECSADCRSCVKQEAATTVMCGDGVSECPDQTTCCETAEGKWACCPTPKAVCCEDKLHCCPEGTTCDVQLSKCVSPSTGREMPMWAKFPARIRAEWEDAQVPAEAANDGESQVTTAANTVPPPQEEATPSSVAEDAGGNDVPCDDTVACEDGTTCCKTKEGGWACCPLPEAVCCEDLLHCCPKGKKCNLTAQTCQDDTCSVPLLKKMPARPRQDLQAGAVQCDSTTSCEDGTTCCKNKEGGWACCPLPEAVCCEDLLHCCPKGKKCNLAAQTCDDDAADGGGSSVPWVEKVPAVSRQDAQAGNVTCDSTTSCEDGTTCCKTKEGGWACCPLPEAVCCDDHEHCCPTGTTCNLATLTCDGTSGPTPMVQKVPAFVTAAPTTTVAATTQAPATSTITQEEEEEEEEQMEPEDEEGGGQEEEEENKEVEDRIQCDAHTSCPHHTTCCFMASSQKWGCCPLPEAVCCADGNHCCPASYKCDDRKTSCVKGEVVIPWYTKLPATSAGAQADPKSVQCDDLSQCPERTTCCRLATGEWGCCPLQNAVCCQDKEHCCPQGYTCNVASNSCQKVIMLQLETVPLTPVYLPEHQPRPQPSPVKHRDVKCDDQTSCPDGNTCCRTSATTWGCCPSPNAVCCSDMQHCCPTGYTCTEGGECTQNARLHWHNWHMFFANKKRALTV